MTSPPGIAKHRGDPLCWHDTYIPAYPLVHFRDRTHILARVAVSNIHEFVVRTLRQPEPSAALLQLDTEDETSGSSRLFD